MRILVTGAREWTDGNLISTIILETILGVEWGKKCITYDFSQHTIIEGECRGADILAREVGEMRGFTIEKYPAKWKQYGRKAGPLRNREMYKKGKPDIVLAFHDDWKNSKGTKDMMKVATDGGTPVRLTTHDSFNADSYSYCGHRIPFNFISGCPDCSIISKLDLI